ncbi:MAG: pyridoxal phosphate-dependent aminotransferase [Candidatus Poribacteria bacterium]|nr:pyridoxal phosphate-dependent aminotransferase [Candidatus Poribacteria bacterium]
MKLAKRMNRLGTESAFEVLAKAKELEAQGKDIVHLEIGQPDFKTPVNVCQVAFQAMKDGQTGYSSPAGLPAFREVVADWVSRTRRVSVQPDQVSVTPGAKPIIFFAVLACADDGDEVIYPDPGFPIYESVINFAGAKPVPLPLKESVDFRFRIEDLEAIVSDRTRLLIINSPQNPTGGVLTRSDLAMIAELAIKHNFYVLSDEIYSQLVYDGDHQSILSIDGMQDRTILLDGHSKSYAMTGWRLGYSVSTKLLADQFAKLMVNSNSCTATFTQIAGIEAMQNSQGFVNQMRLEFKTRRDFLVRGLNDIEGISCIMPSGAFYTFPNVTDIPMTCAEFADYLLTEAGVALLPGSSFGMFGDGYLRMSYASSIDNIQEALIRIDKAVSEV